MSDRLKRLREERAADVVALRAITDKATAEKRDMSDEEVAKHGEIFDKIERSRKLIEAEERSLDVERQEAERQGAEEERRKREPENRGGPRTTEEYRTSFRSFLLNGLQLMSPDERRALSSGSATDGGYIVPAEQFVNELIKAVDDEVFVRRYARKFAVPQATSLGAPQRTGKANTFGWSSELQNAPEDASLKFGKRALEPHPLTGKIRVSRDLLRRAVMGPEAIVREELARDAGEKQEQAFLLGSGAQQPLGVFVASNDGVPTSRDVSADNTSTAITMNGLINAKYTLKAQYWPRARWMFHRDAVKQLAKLRDDSGATAGTGQYLWQPSTQAGQPDRLLGLPMDVNEFCPNTFTAGLYVGLLADWSQYWIVDALDMEMQRLDELHADTNQVGFIGRLKLDGAPVLAEGFVRVKLA